MPQIMGVEGLSCRLAGLYCASAGHMHWLTPHSCIELSNSTCCRCSHSERILQHSIVGHALSSDLVQHQCDMNDMLDLHETVEGRGVLSYRLMAAFSQAIPPDAASCRWKFDCSRFKAVSSQQATLPLQSLQAPQIMFTSYTRYGCVLLIVAIPQMAAAASPDVHSELAFQVNDPSIDKFKMTYWLGALPLCNALSWTLPAAA